MLIAEVRVFLSRMYSKAAVESVGAQTITESLTAIESDQSPFVHVDAERIGVFVDFCMTELITQRWDGKCDSSPLMFIKMMLDKVQGTLTAASTW